MTDSTIHSGNVDDAAALDDHSAEGAHPTESQYWLIFLALVVITAAEVAWSYLGLSGPLLVVPLIIMMVVKFLIVAGAFMHLYFDLKLANGKVFGMVFAGGMVLAMAVYFTLFATFEFQI